MLYSQEDGFSLVEMLVVLVIGMIISSMVVVRFKPMKDSVKILEAKYGLAEFYRLQQSFYIENGHYGTSVGDIGFKSNSKNYKIGFHDSWGGATVNESIGSTCTVDVSKNTFFAGSANQDNVLLNFTISEKNCLQKLDSNSSNCQKAVGDCLLN